MYHKICALDPASCEDQLRLACALEQVGKLEAAGQAYLKAAQELVQKGNKSQAVAALDNPSWRPFCRVPLLRLPHGVADLFEDWLARYFPDRKERVLNRIRETRGGKLYDPRFGSRMRGEGEYAEHLSKLFAVARRQAGIE